jgi:tetratricopeptide (TPR) repeat protein
MQRGDVLEDRFDIEALAGAGGMGQVFRARDRHSGAPVAVKVLLGDIGSQGARFVHETRALSELSHPSIVGYVAHGSAGGGEPYLAMEWLDGEDLACRLERGGLTIDESVALAARVAEALGAAHARGIVHRDLKPSNIFLVGRRIDQVKVLDFGIARLASVTRLTRTGVIIGTPGYMAPEQAQNDRAVDARADVFSLGCVLFECLTGAPAFAAEHVMALLAKVLFAEPPRLRELRPEAPAALEQLVARMLAKDPAERPRDGAAVAEALRALDEGARASGSVPPKVALTRGERRTLAVVLIEADPAARISDDETLGKAEAEAHAAQALRRGAEAFEGRLEYLWDGSVAVSIGGAGLVTDQAAQAARCALWLRANAGGRAVALATGRGEFTGRMAAAEAIDPKLWAERRMQEIQLKQLGKRASERLARHVLGDGAGRDVIDRLVRLSEGNAFYLEELIRRAAEGRGDDLPETVVAMVQSRLGALDDGSRRILRAASVFGEVFWAGAVACLLGVAEGAMGVRERLEELVNRELVVKRKENRFPDEDEYAFRHALLREGAYAMLTDEDRVLGHRLAGEWLEQHGEQDPLGLAEHFERGGEGVRAGVHYLHAAEQALWGGDSATAIARIKRGLAGSIPDELRIRFLGILWEVHYWALEILDDALPYAEELVRVAERGSAPWSQGMVVKQLCSIQGGNDVEFVAMLGVLGETTPLPEAAGPWALGVLTGIYMLDLLGRCRDADSLIEKVAAVVRTVGDREPMASVLFHGVVAARIAYAEENPSKAIEHGEALSELAAAMGHVRFSETAKLMAGMNRWYLGVVEGVERMIMGVTLPDEEMGMASSLRPFVLAWLLADRSAFDEARLWAGRLVESGRSRQFPLDEGRGHWALAEVLRRAGELESADAEIHAALALLGMASPLDSPGALATLAALRLSQGRATEALAAAQDALGKYETMSACGFFRGAFLRLTHAECLEATGSRDAARKAIAIARERLLMIAEKVSNPEYRTSFLENVPENRRTLELARQWFGEGGAVS